MLKNPAFLRVPISVERGFESTKNNFPTSRLIYKVRCNHAPNDYYTYALENGHDDWKFVRKIRVRIALKKLSLFFSHSFQRSSLTTADNRERAKKAPDLSVNLN